MHGTIIAVWIVGIGGVFFLVAVFAIVGVDIIQTQIMESLLLKSSAFKEGEAIPSHHTCDGANVNPLFEIRNIPDRTKSLALIVDDPDATDGATWDHWLVWDMDPKTQYISEDTIPAGAQQGINSFGKTAYGGPCPPKGAKPHRYVFSLYAIDIIINLPEGATRSELETAMEGHVLDEAKLTGHYGRA